MRACLLVVLIGLLPPVQSQAGGGRLIGMQLKYWRAKKSVKVGLRNARDAVLRSVRLLPTGKNTRRDVKLVTKVLVKRADKMGLASESLSRLGKHASDAEQLASGNKSDEAVLEIGGLDRGWVKVKGRKTAEEEITKRVRVFRSTAGGQHAREVAYGTTIRKNDGRVKELMHSVSPVGGGWQVEEVHVNKYVDKGGTIPNGSVEFYLRGPDGKLVGKIEDWNLWFNLKYAESKGQRAASSSAKPPSVAGIGLQGGLLVHTAFPLSSNTVPARKEFSKNGKISLLDQKGRLLGELSPEMAAKLTARYQVMNQP